MKPNALPDSDFFEFTAHELGRALLAGPDSSVPIQIEVQDEHGYDKVRGLRRLNLAVGVDDKGTVLFCVITARQSPPRGASNR